MHSRFNRLIGDEGFSIGLELPLDNDWSSSGRRLAEEKHRPFGVPDIRRHAQLGSTSYRLCVSWAFSTSGCICGAVSGM
jgi:hypothetical protein